MERIRKVRFTFLALKLLEVTWSLRAGDKTDQEGSTRREVSCLKCQVLSFQQILPLSLQLPSQLGMLSGWPSLCKPRLRLWTPAVTDMNNLKCSVSELLQDVLQHVSSSPALQGPNSPLPKRLQKVTQRQLHQQQHLRHRQPQQPRQLHKLHQHKLHGTLSTKGRQCVEQATHLCRDPVQERANACWVLSHKATGTAGTKAKAEPRTPRPRRPQRVESRRTATTMGTRVRTATATAHRAPTAHARVPMSPTPDPKPVPDPSKTRTSGRWLRLA